MYKRLWPGREGWSIRYNHNSSIHTISATNDLQRTLTRGNRCFWISPFPQKVGDYYQIDLKKERIISGFYEIDIETDNQIPLKYSLVLYNRGGIKETEPTHLAIIDRIRGKGRVIEKFPPIKVQRIEIVILEPNLDKDGSPHFWKIFGFELEEVMFFRHFIRRRI